MIKGQRVKLRLIEENDLEIMHQLQSDLSEKGIHSSRTIRSIVHLKKKFQDNGFTTRDFGMFLILDMDDKIVGMIQNFKGASYATGFELGAVIFNKKDRGCGYASEALKLYTAYLFEAHPIHRLEIATSVENTGAQKVALKCGYTFEGVNRKACFIRGVATDVQRYSILREEAPALDDVLINAD